MCVCVCECVYINVCVCVRACTFLYDYSIGRVPFIENAIRNPFKWYYYYFCNSGSLDSISIVTLIPLVRSYFLVPKKVKGKTE